jgi:hypothetical protein
MTKNGEMQEFHHWKTILLVLGTGWCLEQIWISTGLLHHFRQIFHYICVSLDSTAFSQVRWVLSHFVHGILLFVCVCNLRLSRSKCIQMWNSCIEQPCKGWRNFSCDDHHAAMLCQLDDGEMQKFLSWLKNQT